MLKQSVKLLLLITLISIPIPVQGSQQVQTAPSKRPIDMVILIDNSCSMFPLNQIIRGCGSWGSDPEFLRIAGANLFIARLGLTEPNEAEYQLGIFGFGEKVTVMSPLQPLASRRDELSALIASPKAESSTQLVPGLQAAYQEIETSPNRNPDHMPAVVLITDGVPYPPEGQTNTEIEKLVTSKADIPLFMMLLQNQDDPSEEYERYIQFWEELQNEHPNIFVYRIHQASEIKDTYNTILAKLQNTIPSKGMVLSSNEPIELFVGEYIQKIIVTIIRPSADSPGSVSIQDPQGNYIQPDRDDGVDHFLGEQNPVEVITITAPRLSPSLKGQNWTLTSDSDVTVMIDREGGYRINYLLENTAESAFGFLYRALQPQNPSRGDFVLAFELLDWEGNRVLEPQQILGTVTTPDGQDTLLTSGFSPNSEGIYEIRYSTAIAYPPILSEPGRLTFKISAGVADETSAEKLPVASASIMVDFQRVPTIRSIAPDPVICQGSLDPSLRVSVDDPDAVASGTLDITLLFGDQDISLPAQEPGLYTGSLGSVCTVLVRQQACSSQGETVLQVRMQANQSDGSSLVTEMEDVLVRVLAPNCTPTPLPSPTPTPTPLPPPIPDSDKDGLVDTQDECPAIFGLRQFNGCIPWSILWIGGGLFGFLMVTTTWIWPWVRVRTFANPPDGYALVIREGKPLSEPIKLHDLGIRRNTDKIVIGGSRRKSHIYIPGLQKKEVIVERKSVTTVLRDPKEKNPFAYLDEDIRLVYTSDPKVVLRFSMDLQKLNPN